MDAHLQPHDLSAPGREVIQVRGDFDPGYVSPRHTHPGEEIIYVIEGSLEYDAPSLKIQFWRQVMTTDTLTARAYVEL